ncbi:MULTISPECIES: helix-turn-helix domain-containing protein [Amycolatopsis]|uniref:helix-turn-helix domain-containing protein n=1 Tax=Amycolatopsis TaxID=1813 RepID=UPI00106F804A|nr:MULTISPECIES: helix-turn-helix transcriptional regulator [Amycolatopsis]MCG3755930.1 helix-turn-helix transcriptional regulator [Amycolatopsis sp. Poz14]
MSQPNPALAARLRTLRKESWSDVVLTQKQLAEAFGVSTGLLSSWENVAKPVTPPPHRLEAYATFFATRRSVQGPQLHLLDTENLTDDEHTVRKELLAELQALRGDLDDPPAQPVFAPSSLWHFPPNQDIVIVCAQLPEKYRIAYTDPSSPDYVNLYTYADPDALLELYGHIRACNPASNVTFRTTDQNTTLSADEYTAHLVLLGGVDWNPQTRALLDRVDVPVRQISRKGDEDQLDTGFEVTRPDGSTQRFSAKLRDGILLEDVAHFYHGVSPLNRKRTVTVCNGMYGRGTLGAVRALTDRRFRDRNQAYLDQRFAGADSFSIISRVPVFDNQGLTPDWTLPENRLHEWPESSLT